jgi:hypothetical protein
VVRPPDLTELVRGGGRARVRARGGVGGGGRTGFALYETFTVKDSWCNDCITKQLYGKNN